MSVLIGALGALSVLALLVGGFFIGWKAYPRVHKLDPAIQKMSETEKKALLDQQRAFEQVLNYSTETAYGMNRSPDLEKKD
jgi:hypothetical protein